MITLHLKRLSDNATLVVPLATVGLYISGGGINSTVDVPCPMDTDAIDAFCAPTREIGPDAWELISYAYTDGCMTRDTIDGDDLMTPVIEWEFRFNGDQLTHDDLMIALNPEFEFEF